MSKWHAARDRKMDEKIVAERFDNMLKAKSKLDQLNKFEWKRGQDIKMKALQELIEDNNPNWWETFAKKKGGADGNREIVDMIQKGFLRWEMAAKTRQIL